MLRKLKELLITFIILAMTSWILTTRASQASPCSIITDVTQYGAVGDGQTDDSKAFLKAWENICNCGISSAILLIPAQRTFLLKPLRFEGPCRSSPLNVQVFGNIIATTDTAAYAGSDNDVQDWLTFFNVNDLNVNGNGKIDGQGAIWWPETEIDKRRPTASVFDQCSNLQLSGLTYINSPQAHIHLNGCNNALVSNLHITAPESSPNTDGIDISYSSNVQIQDCTIGTGDDCIAVGGGSSNIKIASVTCGPGHGISIGSLGKDGKSETVEEVYVKDSTLKGTTNGLRIKTWQGGSGYARQIHYEGITLDAVDNPIIIDQFYCDHRITCKNQTSAVKVSDIFYNRVHGTSITDEAIQFRCSQTSSCSNIYLSDIDITSANDKGNPTHAFCSNAYGTASYSSPMVNCLTTTISYEGCPTQEERCHHSHNKNQSIKLALDFHLIFVLSLLCFYFLHL